VAAFTPRRHLEAHFAEAPFEFVEVAPVLLGHAEKLVGFVDGHHAVGARWRRQRLALLLLLLLLLLVLRLGAWSVHARQVTLATLGEGGLGRVVKVVGAHEFGLGLRGRRGGRRRDGR
jgi:hypothetical protein